MTPLGEPDDSRTAGPTPVGRFTFIGVTTAGSAIMRVFPGWAAELGLEGVMMHGRDLPIHAQPSRYREIVSALKDDASDLGALVTTHKIDLFEACHDQFDEIDPYAELLGEVSCLSKRDRRFRAHAKDPISSGRSFDDFVEQGYWERTPADALLFGAGGSNLAITIHLLTVREPSDRPRRIIVVNRSPGRLASMRAVHERLVSGVELEYVHNADPRVNDGLLKTLPPGSLVVNGTGMGKDSPGSPVTDEGVFPEHGLVWELNYRGDLDFLHQARRQAAAQSLVVEDGWRYFIHGWACVIEEVFDLRIGPDELERLSEIAAAHR